MKTEIELLREIADEAKNVWDNDWLSLDATHLRNLLTDRIDMKGRHLSSRSSGQAKVCTNFKCVFEYGPCRNWDICEGYTPAT